MLPRGPPTLKGEDARRFIEQDRKPLTEKQKKYLQECLELYRRIKRRNNGP